MPWQPFSPDSAQRKTLREDSAESLAGGSDRFRRRPSYLEEFDMQVGLSGENFDFIIDFHLFSLRKDQRRMDLLGRHQNNH